MPPLYRSGGFLSIFQILSSQVQYRNHGAVTYLSPLSEATNSADVVGKNSYFLRVSLLSVIGKVVVNQVIVQVLSRNTIETVYKPFQSAVVGVHALDVVESKLIDFYSL